MRETDAIERDLIVLSRDKKTGLIVTSSRLARFATADPDRAMVS
jgi:hypothetical protein